MNSILKCSKYAFGPNRLHYCGPDANNEILAYIDSGATDPGLGIMLEKFQTLYPYLELIARANNIADPFDDRVVNAYWLGNSLLDAVDRQRMYSHLLDVTKSKDKMGAKPFEYVVDKIRTRAVPHHSFHVFNIWKRTGFNEAEHTIESMDLCRISAGKVIELSGPFVKIETDELKLVDGKLALVPAQKQISRPFEVDIKLEELKVGDLVSAHWKMICEPITERQKVDLTHYTNLSLALANTTL
ncbi:MAG: DUF6390 family protein [bacterium]